MISEASVETIDLENLLAHRPERSEVVLFMWIVGVAEIIKDGDRFGKALYGFLTECNAWGHNRRAFDQVLAEPIVDTANPLSLHRPVRSFDVIGCLTDIARTEAQAAASNLSRMRRCDTPVPRAIGTGQRCDTKSGRARALPWLAKRRAIRFEISVIVRLPGSRRFHSYNYFNFNWNSVR